MNGRRADAAAPDDRKRPLDDARRLLQPLLERLVAARASGAVDEYRRLAEASPVIVWLADPDGRARFLNTRWQDFTGLDERRSVGYGWNDAIHRDDLDSAFGRWTHAINTGEPLDVTYRFRARDGQYRLHLGRAILRREAGGRAIEWVGACIDLDALTEGRAVETAPVRSPESTVSQQESASGL